MIKSYTLDMNRREQNTPQTKMAFFTQPLHFSWKFCKYPPPVPFKVRSTNPIDTTVSSTKKARPSNSQLPSRTQEPQLKVGFKIITNIKNYLNTNTKCKYINENIDEFIYKNIYIYIMYRSLNLHFSLLGALWRIGPNAVESSSQERLETAKSSKGSCKIL